MKVLVAEDDALVRHVVERLLSPEYEVISVSNGDAAWELIQQQTGPRLGVLDWQMPGLDGTEVCRRARRLPDTPTYLILMTATRKSAMDLLEGFDAGADDYLTKPFNADELRARLAVGRRVLELQQSLAQRIVDLKQALARVHTLEGLLPICAWCKRIRDDNNYWEQLEIYIAEHTEASFTHGICPECCEKLRSEDVLHGSGHGRRH